MNETTELIMKQLNQKKVHAITHEVGGGDEIDATKLKNIGNYLTTDGDFTGTWNGYEMTSVDAGLAAEFDALKAETLQQMPNHYYVGANQRYVTITSAFNQWVSDGKPTSVIHIFAGVYNEDINGGSNVNLTFIGEDKNTTIWKCTKGLYVNAPFTGSGGSDGLHFRNLTIESNHDDIPGYIYKASTGGGAYALHIDDPDSEGINTIEDCVLISYQNSALGCGTRLNQEITLKNVELYHYAEQYSTVGGENTGANNGAILYHTSATAGHTGQKVKFKNVYAWSLKGPALQMLSSSGGTVPVAVEITNFTARSPYYEGINIDQRVVFSNTNGLMVLDENSKYNNSSYLNYKQTQMAKLTEDDGKAILVTDFNTPRSGYFMGNGAAGCLNTPTSAWYFGEAISYSGTSYCVQYVWDITVGRMLKYKRSFNGTTWRAWVPVDEAGLFYTTAARPTNLTLGENIFDTTLNKPLWLKTEPSTWVEANGSSSSKYGNATILSGGNSIVVTHGLGATPTNVIVTPRANVGSVWVTALSSTQFTINCSTAAAADTIVSWDAKV